MAEFGAGPRLDESFDLAVSSTGDIDTISGSPELEKDLAFQTANTLDDEIGRISDEDSAIRIRDRVFDTIIADSRVLNVNRLNLSIVGQGSDEVRVEALVQTDDGEQELVFNV